MHRTTFSGAPVSDYFFLYRILLTLVFFVLMGAGIAGASVTFSWQANPPEDNVIGYRLYYGSESRFATNGTLNADFPYDYYIDFLEFKRCVADGTDTECENLYGDDFQCENLYGEVPQCSVNNLQGRLYFALTAYSSQAESNFTPELSLMIDPDGPTGPGGHNKSVLPGVLSLLLLSKK